ncbi:MAG: response regulator transcription factor [Polyangiaceae bacterium]
MTAILVVEDEPAIAESLAYSLSREGYSVNTAGSLAEAEPKLSEASLIILDLMLPDGSGFDLLARLQRSAAPPAVIILSSRDQEADRVAGLETGADDYITKPFSPREVVARVRAVLRRTNTRTKPAATTLALQADADTRRASVDGTALELTRVEFDRLNCLLSVAGRVFTRSQLIETIWGDNFAITDRTVDSHVKALRRKLSDAGGDPGLIETVRGVGYRVSEQVEHAGASDEANT